jgi:DNA-binding transcriptional regulator YbjK
VARAAREQMSDKPFGLTCEECGAILREFREAVKQDEQALKSRLRNVANASGRDEDAMRLAWISSVASAPGNEMQTIMRAQFPRIEDMRRKQAEHEARSGHAVFRDGWRTMRMPYDDLLKVMRVLSAIR